MSKMSDHLKKTWHLAQDSDEASLCIFEGALWSTFQSQQRWSGECSSAAGFNVNGPENSILNFIRMQERPKALSEIAHFLNRDDLSNIQYSIRKLQQMDLIQKYKGKNARREVTYVVTEKGRALTDQFAELRRALIIKAIKQVGVTGEQLEQVASIIKLMGGFYESCAREVVICRPDGDFEN